jgi:hypothetical protein
MLTTANTTHHRPLMRVSAAVMLLLLVGFTVLMHSMASTASSAEHSMAVTMSTTAAQDFSAAGHAVHSANEGSPTTALPSDTGCDGGLCGLMRSLLGMACVLTIALFAWSLLRPRAGGILYILARLLALADRVARRVAVPKPPSLSELQIIRI